MRSQYGVFNPANYELVSMNTYYSGSLSQSISLSYDAGTHLLPDYTLIDPQVTPTKIVNGMQVMELTYRQY